MGRKKQPSYRIVVTEDSDPRDGPSIERLGIYNPRTQPAVIRLDASRALHWLHQGAQPSDTVRSLFRQTGVWEQFHAGVTPEAVEEAVIHLGPAMGDDRTTQRVSGEPKKPKAKAGPTPAPTPPPPAVDEDEPAEDAATEAAEEPEAAAAEAEGEEPEPAGEEEADEETVDEEVQAEVQPIKAEAEEEAQEEQEAEPSEEEEEEEPKE